MENHPGKQRNHKYYMAPVLAKQLDFSSLLVAYRKAQGGGEVRAGFKRGTRPAKGVWYAYEVRSIWGKVHSPSC